MTHKQPSQRQLRVGEEVRHALAFFLQREDLRDPALSGAMISVSEVQMTPDLKLATCFIMPLDSTDPQAPAKEQIVAALNSHAKYIRGQLSAPLRGLRSMPQFRFKLDTSFDNFAKIDALLHSPAVARDLQKNDETEAEDKAAAD